MEFWRRGYQVVVPNMKRPWCVHDCGFINLQNYDGEKEKFIAEYLADAEEWQKSSAQSASEWKKR